jgi:hypothetical protein
MTPELVQIDEILSRPPLAVLAAPAGLNLIPKAAD